MGQRESHCISDCDLNANEPAKGGPDGAAAASEERERVGDAVGIKEGERVEIGDGVGDQDGFEDVE